MVEKASAALFFFLLEKGSSRDHRFDLGRRYQVGEIGITTAETEEGLTIVEAKLDAAEQSVGAKDLRAVNFESLL